uniref:Ethylene-responsive transcription factor n=1 Tax=Myoviridae sp. ctHP32 TaxID=2823539 RepID=A0A8S5LFL4_9CAUD|nr:MAG TPA: ethylene-responsive transcription factor [Myoviridae sp. ctHP32]
MRVIKAQANRYNKGLDKRNKTGCAGVFWYDRYKKYQVSITINGETKHLGYFSDYEEAVNKRKQAEEKYFGEYRRK